MFEKIMSTLFGEGFNLADSFGKEGIMGMLGSEGTKNLFSGVTGLMDVNQTGDLMDFQKKFAKKADARTERSLAMDEEDRKLNQDSFSGAADILGF